MLHSSKSYSLFVPLFLNTQHSSAHFFFIEIGCFYFPSFFSLYVCCCCSKVSFIFLHSSAGLCAAAQKCTCTSRIGATLRQPADARQKGLTFVRANLHCHEPFFPHDPIFSNCVAMLPLLVGQIHLDHRGRADREVDCGKLRQALG